MHLQLSGFSDTALLVELCERASHHRLDAYKVA
jgi:hypothetical protein